MNDHKSNSRIGQVKHIVSRARRFDKKFQAVVQSFDVLTRACKEFSAARMGIISDTRIDRL